MGFGRMLVILGIVLVLFGVLVSLGGRLPFRIGRLPGDIEIRGRNTVFYFPLMTSIILSVVFSLIVWLFNRR
jgi:Protein of unknown function (DUF2905)